MGKSSATAKTQVTEYRMSIHFGVCAGPVDSLQGVIIAEEKQVLDEIITQPSIINVSKRELFGGIKKEGGVEGAITYLSGDSDQILSNTLAGKFGKTSDDCPAFRGVCSLFFTEAYTDTGGTVDNVIGTPVIWPAPGFYWGANSPYLRTVWAKVSRVFRGWNPATAAIDHGERTERALWIAMDVSLSMAGTRFTTLKSSMSTVLDQIEAAVAAGTKIHLGISAWGGTYTVITRNNITVADIADFRSFVNSRTLVSSTDFTQGVTPAVNWLNTFATGMKKILVFITDGEPVPVETAATAQAALTFGPGIESYGINIELANTTYTQMVDNTPLDGVPVVSGSETEGLTNAISKALFPDPLSPDMNPAHIIYECLTNTEWGMGSPTVLLDDASFTAAASTLYAESFGLSMKWTRQTTIEAFVGEVLDHIEGAIYVDPTTGKITLKLIRDDYDVSTLQTLDPDNCTISDFQVKPPAERINEIVVSYTDPKTEDETSYTYQDLGSIASQGAIISDSRNYYGVRYLELARRLAQRDLRAGGAPLATCSAEVNRTVTGLVPGAVVKLHWPEYGIDEMVMRVGPVGYGKPGSPTIKVSLIQDVFTRPLPILDDADDDGIEWEDPSDEPTPADAVVPLTLPYYATVPLDSSIEEPEAYAGLLVAKEGTDSTEYELYGEEVDSLGNATLGNIGTRDYSARGELTVAISAEVETTFAAPTLSYGNGPQVGGFALFGTAETDMELCVVTAYSAPDCTVRRGVLDTVPKAWPIGTPVWFFGGSSRVADTITRAVGEVVDYYVLPRTTGGLLPLASSALTPLTMTERPHRPLRPANVQINGIGFGVVDLSDGTTGGVGSTAPVVADTPSVWAATQGWYYPRQVPGKDFPVGIGVVGPTPSADPMTGGQGITEDTNTYYINAPDLYENYDFGNKRVVATFAHSDTETCKFKNCHFRNGYVTSVAYFGADMTAGTILRSDCSYEYCTFEGVPGGGGGECINNPKGLVGVFRCKFLKWVGDLVTTGGGYFRQNYIELCGADDGVHYDVVNWADTSIGPLHYEGNYIDASLGKYPNAGGGFNSLLKLVPVGGPGPTHDLVFEDQLAWFSAAPNGEGSADVPANNGWYWLQNVGGTGQFRFLNNYLGMLRQDGPYVFIAVPGSNFALQNFMKLHDNNNPWSGPNSDTTSSLPKPLAPVVSLVQTASDSTHTFTLGANTTFLEYQYREKGTDLWLPRGIPAVATSDETLPFGDDHEVRYRGVFSTSGRRTTGLWTYKNQDTAGGASPPAASGCVVSWANRNRVTETSAILAWDGASVAPEAGQTTRIALLDVAKTPIKTIDGVGGTSYVVNTGDFGGVSRGFIRVTSMRDGLESMQGHEIEVVLASGYGYGYGMNYGG